MAQLKLSGKRVAILVEDGFEQVELTSPKEALEAAGAQTHIISPKADKVKGWEHTKWGQEFPVDVGIDQANANNYDALLLPGGVMNPDKLRTNKKAVQFVHSFFDQEKPVAAICHGPWMLVEADVVEGRTVTSYPFNSNRPKKCRGELGRQRSRCRPGTCYKSQTG